MSFFLVFCFYGLFTTTFPMGKMVMGYASPLFVTGVRMSLAGLIMLSYLLLRGGMPSLRFSRRAWLLLAALGTLNIYLTNFLEYWGLQYLTSAKACFIYSLSPFLCALFGKLFFGENLSKGKILGMVIGFVGMIPLFVGEVSSAEDAVRAFGIFSWPELSLLGAVICSVWGWLLLDQLVNSEEMSPIQANGFSMLLGGSMALITSAMLEGWDPSPVSEWGPFAMWISLLLLVSNLICYNCYGLLLKRFSATFVSFAGFSCPFFAAWMGWVFFGESVSWGFCTSMIIVFAGLWVFFREELQVKAKVKPA